MKGEKVAARRRKPVGAGLGVAGAVREGEAPARVVGETARDYRWFVAYWKDGAAMSLRAIAKGLGADVGDLSRARRVRQWDARVQAALEEPAEVKQGWVARREALREAEWKLHQECLEVGREALKAWRESGRTASLGDVVKLLELGTKLARMAAGMPDNHVMITGEEGEPIRVQFEAALAQAYGPVVEVASEVVEVQTERCLNGKRNREAGEVRGEGAAVEGSPGGGDILRGTDAGAVGVGAAAGGLAGEGNPRPDNEGGAS